MSASVPIYQQIFEDLKSQISAGKYSTGDYLPTEQELQKAYSTSRTTIRNAIRVLQEEGFISRRQGRGTVLISRSAVQQLNYISSFSETLSEKGMKAETGLLSIRKSVVTSSVAEKLGISPGTLIYTMHRTKIVEGKVIGFLNNRIVAVLVPELEAHLEKLREHGLYETVESLYKLELASAVETISVHLSSGFENDIFEVSDAIPIFLSERVTRLSDGRVFEYVTTHVRAEGFEYRVALQGRKNPKTATKGET